MNIRNKVLLTFAEFKARQIRTWSQHPVKIQQQIFAYLVHTARGTAFGNDHAFGRITRYADFTRQVPLRDYEGLRPYINRILAGEKDVLWPGIPKYLAKTSGTTSGIKYIPITHASTPFHVGSARNAVFCYMAETGRSDFMTGKMIFLSGSPELDKKAGILTGRLSGIVNHEIPEWMKKGQLPSYATNCIEDWEEKLSRIVQETVHQNMSLIGGIPSWVQMYFERLLETTGKSSIQEVFPNLELYVYGGVNFTPYKPVFDNLLGKKIQTIETYPASEGFIAFQDTLYEEGLLLNLNGGIFFEFIKASEAHMPDATRYSIGEVETGVNYALVLNTNAGLWGYIIGDTIRFVSLNPPRIVVTGRTKHFISAFGEHVIAEEVESAMAYACNNQSVRVTEFHVAPQVQPESGELPYHEWFIEFEKEPESMHRFTQDLNTALVEKNIYYRDLMDGNILQMLKIRKIQKDGFRAYMKSQGKLGGQNKVPRLADTRELADALKFYTAG